MNFVEIGHNVLVKRRRQASGGGPKAWNELERFVMFAIHEKAKNQVSCGGELRRLPISLPILPCIGISRHMEIYEPNIFENICRFLGMTAAA